MTTTLKPVYVSNNQALTITIASLTTGSINWSSAIDNTTNLYDDIVLMGKIKSGAASTSATGYVNIRIAVSCDGGTTYDAGVLNTDILCVVNMVANATTYYLPARSIASLFGGQLPPLMKVGLENQSGGTLDTTAGNHSLFYSAQQAQLV